MSERNLVSIQKIVSLTEIPGADRIETPPGKNCIKTNSDTWIDLIDPQPKQINIEDIAHALSMCCRFGGHITEFYSIAAHSLAVERRARYYTEDKKDLLYCLLHDASEAYLGDMVKPLKRAMPDYQKAELDLQVMIYRKYGLSCIRPWFLAECDEWALNTEAFTFGKSWAKDTGGKIVKDSPGRFKQAFLRRFYQLACNVDILKDASRPQPYETAPDVIKSIMDANVVKHGPDKWRKENIAEHLIKGSRHMLTAYLQETGLSPKDGENHIHNALCRVAMAATNQQEKEG